jgi:hypothetical protein
VEVILVLHLHALSHSHTYFSGYVNLRAVLVNIGPEICTMIIDMWVNDQNEMMFFYLEL